MTSDLQRAYLANTCRWLATYIEDGHPVHLKTVHGDGEPLADLVKETPDRVAIIFTIDDWEAFREIMEARQGTERRGCS